MKRSSFNTGWAFRPRRRSFLEAPELGEPWTQVTLPHDAMLTQPRDPAAEPDSGYFPGGVWEYTKTFDAPADTADTHLVLEFEGVYRDAVVEVNGDLVARNAYGYSQFHVELDPCLRAGEKNILRVEATAGADSRWYSGAGIYRPVHLLTGGLVHVTPAHTRVVTRSISRDRAVVEVCARVENRTRGLRRMEASIVVIGPNGGAVARITTPVTVSPGAPADLTQRLVVTSPQLWSVDTPHLYRCRIELRGEDETVLDEETTTFGIRALELDSTGLRINGRTVKLRGACVHHDNGILGAATIDRADERRVELLRAAGFNALRSAHNPMSRAMLDACDRLGMLVMDEAFDTWTRPKRDHDYAKDFTRCWEQDLLAMVRKDVNHPSVIMYSIGNEIPEIATSTGRQWSRRLAERLRAADPSRPVTNGVNASLACPSELVAAIASATPEGLTEDFGVNTLAAAMFSILPRLMRSALVDERTEEAFACLDAAGYNYLHDRYELDAELHPHRVIVGTEVMPAAVATSWQQIQQLDHVIGDFCWTGWDYLGEAGIGRISYDPGDDGAILNAFPHLTATSGDLDITGHRLPISYYRETVYGLRTEPYVVVQDPQHHGIPPRHRSPWSWTDAVPSWTWPGYEGKPATISVYADAEEVEVVLNGDSQGRQRITADKTCRLESTVDYRPGELVVIAYTGGQEVGRTALRTAAGDAVLAVQADRSTVRADDTDLAYLSIALVDAQGTPVPRADRRVEVTVSGPGTLQGLGTGNPRTVERFDSSECRTFEGRALAIIRPTGAGEIAVTVAAPDCPAVTTVLQAAAATEVVAC